nr:hypothetical protein L204_06327 [Cryptococcus depauperatus CBS 7855]
MAQRVTLRKRQPYNTTSNRRRVVKTPGGKLVVHHLKKIARGGYELLWGGSNIISSCKAWALREDHANSEAENREMLIEHHV